MSPVVQDCRVAKDVAIGGWNYRVLLVQMVGNIAGLERHPEAENFLERQLQLGPYLHGVREGGQKCVVEQPTGGRSERPVQFPHLESGGSP